MKFYMTVKRTENSLANFFHCNFPKESICVFIHLQNLIKQKSFFLKKIFLSNYH